MMDEKQRPNLADVIEAQLTLNNYPDFPEQVQLSSMAHQISTKFNYFTSLEIAVYLRKRMEEKQAYMILSHKVDFKPESIFKIFAESKNEQPLKIRKKEQRKDYICRSKRKVKPTEICDKNTLEDLVQFLDNNTNDCHIIFEKKNKKTNTQKEQSVLHQSCQWVYNQYFYSTYDRGHLKEDDILKKIFQELKINPEKMTYYDQRMIRLSLPKPKIFGQEFISSQVERLNEVRNQVRSFPRQRSRGQGQLSVGREVIAVHPVCGHLHMGSILAFYKENQYMVKFAKPELGTQKVVDTNMTLKQINNPHRVIVQNINYEVMALAIKLLQYKADLIKLLKQYNNIAEQMKKRQSQLDNTFFQQYGWIGSTINILSLGIRHIISKFRLRGLDQNNQQKIGKNFSSVLLDPLHIMERELDKSQEILDANASSQIKKIISNYKETKTEQISREIFTRNWSRMKENDWPIEKREEIEKLLRCLVGLLVNLKIEHRNFNIQDNKYLNELMEQFDTRYPEHFNEIYELLSSITTKLNSEEIK